MTTTTTHVTPDELLAMPEGKDFELVNGQLVERQLGIEASFVAHLLGRLLGNFCAVKKLGYVFDSEAGFRCFPNDPDKVRKPDVSFVALGRFPNNRLPQGWATIAPDLVVEVLSPNDMASDVNVKVGEYLEAGVRLVWVIDPIARAVLVNRAAPNPAARLTEHDSLTGDDVIPGFACTVSELLPPK